MRHMKGFSTRATLALVLGAAGFLSAVALAGCGGGGNAAGQGPTVSASVSVSPPTVTRERPTVTREADASTVTVTESQPVATTTEPRPTVTLDQPTTVLTLTTTTATLQQAPATTAAAETSSGGTPTWVWVVLAIVGAGALIGLIVALTRRSSKVSADERRRLVSATVASWTAQGWAIESQAESSAVMRRDGERVLVSVDADGHVMTAPVAPPVDDQARG
jgi:hypothetical protein